MENGITIWFTGLPCSGKSTLAQMLHQELQSAKLRSEIFDGDEFRQRLGKGLGYSKEDRIENVRRLAYVAKILNRNGVIAIVAAISPYRVERDEIKKDIGCFLEVFVDCPLEICISRDVKGMYQKALAGEIAQFTGVSDPYEEPLNPDLILKTASVSPGICVSSVINLLTEQGYILFPR